MSDPFPGAIAKRNATRRKLLNLLPRNKLEEISGLERPWHANKSDLLDRAVNNWDGDEMQALMNDLLRKAL